jgi:hypothetical protein
MQTHSTINSQISKVSPLMQPVHFEGQVYFTSRYFHAQYLANKPEGAKYKQLKHFNRLIRSLETYSDYVSRGDIVELEWGLITGPNFGPVDALFKETKKNPIMLINATAQIALTHHLDDEISKNASVSANESIAKKYTNSLQAPRLLTVVDESEAAIKLATLFGLTGNQALLSADRAVFETVGVSPLKLLGHAALESEIQESLLTVTEIGNRLGLSRNKVNPFLESIGLITGYRNHKNQQCWSLTDKGKEAGGIYLDTGKKDSQGAMIQQVKWYSSVVDWINSNAKAVA